MIGNSNKLCAIFLDQIAIEIGKRRLDKAMNSPSFFFVLNWLDMPQTKQFITQKLKITTTTCEAQKADKVRGLPAV